MIIKTAYRRRKSSKQNLTFCILCTSAIIAAVTEGR